MVRNWWKRLFATPAPRGQRRRASARPRFEVLEGRDMPAVFTGLVNGQLVVSTDDSDDLTIDHSGSSTLVNGIAIPDASITNGIKLEGGFQFVKILATVKPITADGELDFHIGKAGKMEGIQAPLDLGVASFVTLDDSNDETGRTVTMNFASGIVTISGLGSTVTFDVGGSLFGAALNFVTVRGGKGADTFNILDTPNVFVLLEGRSITTTNINTGGGADTVNVLATRSNELNIEGEDGRDTVRIGRNGSLNSIDSPINITNTHDFTSLVVDGSAGADPLTVTMAVANGFGTIDGLAPEQIRYKAADTSAVRVKAGNFGNTFTVDGTFSTTAGNVTTLDTGTGADTVNVLRTTGQLTVNGQNGQDTVNVGGTAGSIFGTGNIQGKVFVTNTGSRTALNVSDFRAAIPFNGTGHVVTVDHTAGLTGTGTVHGLAGADIQYVNNDVRSVTLTGSDFADSFFVRSTPESGVAAPVTVNGLGGADFFSVGSTTNTLDQIRGPVTVNGGLGGGDFLAVNDQGSTIGHFYGVTPTTVTRQIGNSVAVNYSGMESLNVNKSTVPIVFTPDPFFPAAKNLALPKKAAVGQAVTLSGRLVDGDPGDVLSLAVDWGDGSEPHRSTPDRAPFAVQHAYAAAGKYTVRAIWTDSHGASNFRELVITVTSPPAVQGVAVGNGSPQRSMVKKLTVTFDQAVTLDPGALELRRNGQPVAGVAVNVASSVQGGKTVAVLTFSGAGVVGGSLADGNYELVIHGARVRNAQGQVLGGDRVESFFRLFGDTDGDRDVDAADRAVMQATVGKQAGQAGFRAFLDSDTNGRVGGPDLREFDARLGQTLPG